MKKKLILLAFALILAAPFAAGADICEDINDMADGWNEMANAIDEAADEGFTRREEREADEAIEEAFVATQEFADLLEDEGNNREQRLGRQLNRALDQLDRADFIEGIIDTMDGVVDALDDITDYCDEQ